MANDHTKKSLRSFQCRDYLWEMYAEMADDLDCSVDYLVNEAMRQYAKSRNYNRSAQGGRGSIPPSGSAPAAGMRESFEPENPAILSAPATSPTTQAQPATIPPGRSPAASLLEGADLTPPPAPLPASPPAPALPPMPGTSAGRISVAEGSPSFGLPPMPAAPAPRPAAPAPALPPLHAAAAPAPALPPLHAGGAGAPALPPMPPLAPPVLPPLPPAPPPAAALPPMPAAAPPAPAQAAGRPTLFVIFNGQKVPVTGDEFVIGRSAKTADLAIKDGNISRRHASVVYHGGAFYMKDLGSTNGVDFSGQKVGTKRIDEGDVFTICEYELRFTYT